MGEEQRQALAELFAQDEGFKAAMVRATSVSEAVRIAGEYGLTVTADDFGLPEGAELSDTELEAVPGAGGPWRTLADYCNTSGLFCTVNPILC